MHLNKKVYLLVLSLAFIITLLNMSPPIAYNSTEDLSLSNADTLPAPQNRYAPSAVPMPPGMVAYWRLDEGSGTHVSDSITPYIPGDTMQNPAWTTGVAGSGLQILPGQYVYFGAPTYLNLANTLTLEAWVNLPNVAGLHTIITNSLNPTYKQFHFAISDGRLFFDRYQGGPGNEVLSNAIITSNQWYHVVVTMNWPAGAPAGEVAFYINGVGETHPNYNDVYSGPSAYVTIGVDWHAQNEAYLNGLIDEVAVYDEILPLSYIQEHYQKGLRGLGYLDDYPMNTPPEASDDSFSAVEDTPLTIPPSGVLMNDVDADGDALTAVPVAMPSHGTLSLFPDGSFNYVPAHDFFGDDTFTYRASDGEFLSNVATVRISVAPVNDPPVSVDDAYTTDEDVSLTVHDPGVLVNDYDVDRYDLIYARLVSDPEHGSVIFFREGGFDYTPAHDWYGVDHFRYLAFDASSDGNVATVTITVRPVNDAPVANDDVFTMDEDTSLTILASDLLANDIDVDGDLLSIEIVTQPDVGTFVIVPNQEFTFTPDPDWYGVTTFSYRVSDGAETSSEAYVTIIVNDVIDDITPPTTTISLSGTVGNDGWYLSAVTVTLTATDDTSTLITTWYSVDGQNWIEYTGSFVYSVERTTTISFYSVDEYGNTEDAKDQEVKIDLEPPQSLLTTERIYGGVNVTIGSEDAISGVAAIYYSLDQETWDLYSVQFTLTSGHIVPVYYYAVDFAGHQEEVQSTDVVVDDVPPETSIALSGIIGDKGWFVSGVMVTLTATDEFSVASTMYSLDGIKWMVYKDPFVVSDDGLTTIYYYSIDSAGNVETTKSESIIIDTDTTGPIITILYTGDATDGNPGYWTVTVVDPESGVDSVTVEIDGVLMGKGSGDYVVPNSLGIHTIRVNATNADLKAGVDDQEFSTLSETVTIVDDDTTGPLISIAYTGGATLSNPGSWTVTVEDPESGIASIIVKVDNEVVGTAAGEFNVPALEGTHNITVTAYNGDLDRGELDQEMSVESATVEVSGESKPGFVTGGGWIIDANGHKAHFAFVVRLKENGDIRGVFVYTFKEGKWLYMVTSTEFLRLVIDGKYAYFEAKCDIRILNFHRCKSVHIDGDFMVRVDIWDNQGCRAKDIFQIRIFDSSGQVWYEAGYDPMGYVHGAIVIHEYKRLKSCHCHHGRW
jgi:hypothetical protein